jgi:uncharacterized protein (TIGR02145 family)
MKNLLLAFLLLGFVMSCTQEEENPNALGEVSFSDVSFKSFSGMLPNGRIEANSTWKHVFKNEARLEVKSKSTGHTFFHDFNPNNFGTGFKLELPYGDYTYVAKVEGQDYERFFPFQIQGQFTLNRESMNIIMEATTDYGLITVKNEHIKSLGIRLGNEVYDFGLLPDRSFHFLYAKKGLTANLEIVDIFENKTLKKEIPIQSYNHYNYSLKLVIMGTVNFIELALDVFQYSEEEIPLELGQSIIHDAQGNAYRTVKIGNQVWMAENLRTVVGNSICYNNDPANCLKYGRLYDWNTARTACPQGWHLPSEQEWRDLANSLGGLNVAGGKLKSITGWNPPNAGATNESGFSAFPAGYNYLGDGRFYYLGEVTWFWHSTVNGGGVTLISYRQDFSFGANTSNRFSCRCVKD